MVHPFLWRTPDTLPITQKTSKTEHSNKLMIQRSRTESDLRFILFKSKINCWGSFKENIKKTWFLGRTGRVRGTHGLDIFFRRRQGGGCDRLQVDISYSWSGRIPAFSYFIFQFFHLSYQVISFFFKLVRNPLRSF